MLQYRFRRWKDVFPSKQVTYICAMDFMELSDELRRWMLEQGFNGKALAFLHLVIGFLFLSALCFVMWWITRQVLIRIIRKVIIRTKEEWVPHLIRYKVFRKLALIFIAFVISRGTPWLFRDYPHWKEIAIPITRIYIIVAIGISIAAILNTISIILESSHKYSDKPIRSYKQIAKIVVYLAVFVLILGVLLGKSVLFVLGGFGAVTAVMLLIFRDPILGFVASIQMSAVDLVRVGDWITVDKYGADGDVMEINLTTVKVRNWDMTVTVVPSYALVSESFRNWRGMIESEGRRIKRHVNIKISSIRFCDEALFQKLRKLERIREYLDASAEEIDAYNSSHGVDQSNLVNGKHLTNIGIFRVYVQKYLEENPFINRDMMFMVRQLQATESGLPIEIYAFTTFKQVEQYEEVAADIFDHILATVPYFELEIFQNPSGSDMRMLRQGAQGDMA